MGLYTNYIANTYLQGLRLIRINVRANPKYGHARKLARRRGALSIGMLKVECYISTAMAYRFWKALVEDGIITEEGAYIPGSVTQPEDSGD